MSEMETRLRVDEVTSASILGIHHHLSHRATTNLEYISEASLADGVSPFCSFDMPSFVQLAGRSKDDGELASSMASKFMATDHRLM